MPAAIRNLIEDAIREGARLAFRYIPSSGVPNTHVVVPDRLREKPEPTVDASNERGHAIELRLARIVSPWRV